jgi:hypothetical protein
MGFSLPAGDILYWLAMFLLAFSPIMALAFWLKRR